MNPGLQPQETEHEADADHARGISPVSDGIGGSHWWAIAAFLAVMAVLALWSVMRASTHPARTVTLRPVRAAPASIKPSWLTSAISAAQPQPALSVPALPPAPLGAASAAPIPRPPAAAHAREAVSPLLVVNLDAGTAPAKPLSPAGASVIQGHLPQAAAPDTLAPEARADSTPAEGFAERTRSFARRAAAESAEVALARRLDMDWRIASGKLIHGVLETAIQSDLPGPLRAIVSEPVFSENGRHRLIAPGSRLVGEYRAGLALGQSRVFIIWKRLLGPDGTSVSIGSEGTDSLGRAGLGGDVDRHFLERFSTATLLSLIGSTTTAVQGNDSVVVNTAQGFGQVAQSAFQDLENLPPTINVDQGAPIVVFVQRDLDFSELAEASP